MHLNSQRLMQPLTIHGVFAVLLTVAELLIFAHWRFSLVPRLEQESQAAAELIAQSQGAMLAAGLEQVSSEADQLDLLRSLDTLLFSRDPISRLPYFTQIQLEVNYDAVPVEVGSMETIRSSADCYSCQSVKVELYASANDEIIGLATFTVSDVFLQGTRQAIFNGVIFQAIVVLLLLAGVWQAGLFALKWVQRAQEREKELELALVEAQQEVETATRTQNDFLANISHEIRTPMNAMIGLCYLVLKTGLSYQQRIYLEKIQSSSRVLLSIVNDILDFSKIETGNLELESKPFVLDEVLHALGEMVMPRAGEKDLNILFNISPNVPQKITGDPLRLGQILLNLTNNAVKFTPHGEVIVSARIKSEATDMVLLEFSVKDTGIGIPKERINTLFTPFTQADSSTSRQFEGSGLGLAICANLVAAMKGKIFCRSTVGRGSTFSFTAQFRRESQAKDYFVLPKALAQKPVLVVDDHASSREVLADMLTTFGFQVDVADSGGQAIDFLCNADKPKTYRLILMDCKMPGINGLDTAKMIKELVQADTVPSIILTSAHGVDEELDRNSQYFDGLLVKPITLTALYNSVAHLLAPDRHHQLQSSQQDSLEQIFRKYPGKKVLLVEDNRTNQEVASTLLKDAEIAVEIANNGEEGLEKFDRKQHDLVLMDVQMPVMDGYQATRAIRGQESNANGRVPIIAITAHAMQGDREKCLQAGMDDYLTKPIDVSEFYQALNRWLDPDNLEAAKQISAQSGEAEGPSAYDASSPAEAAKATAPDDYGTIEFESVIPANVEPKSSPGGVDASAALSVEFDGLTTKGKQGSEKPQDLPATKSEPSKEETRDNTDLRNLKGIDIDAALLRLGNNEELLIRLLTGFEMDNEDAWDSLNAIKETKNWPELKMAVHRLKGEAGNVGATEVEKTARQVESLILHEQFQDMDSTMERLRLALEEVFEAVRTLPSEEEEVNATGVGPELSELDLESTEALLVELAELLETNNMKACDLGRLLKKSIRLSEAEEYLNTLSKCLNKLDFEGAKAPVAAMRSILSKMHHG